MLHSNKLAILMEICLVLAPTYVCLILGYRPESDFISLGANLVPLGGPFIYLGMIISFNGFKLTDGLSRLILPKANL